ncbi:MAG: hypothetical protein HFJ95_03340 [Muribaculaceae bacterium]|nr:hypothetical protein [Muribaculaceae bacterium]
MATDYISLLNLTYEIEGLLMLHINRGEESAPEMTRLLEEKVNRLASSFGKVSASDAADERIVLKQELQPVSATSVQLVTETEESNTPAATVTPAKEADDEEYNDDFTPAAPTAEQEAIAASALTEEAEDASAPLRLEEKLARDRARDIFKAFTINDKFRFRRELFRNSQEEFDETLYVIAQMSNFEEAEDYFYNDLCWNPESEDVKEFMDIVKNHF